MSDLSYTFIDLTNTPSYDFNATCLGNALNFRTTWSTRASMRCLMVRDQYGDCILQNTYLVPYKEYEFNFNSTSKGFYGRLMLVHKNGKEGSTDYLNWADNFFISVYIKYEA